MSDLAYLAQHELIREIGIAQAYIIPSLPPGCDAANDYWRRRYLDLLAENLKRREPKS